MWFRNLIEATIRGVYVFIFMCIYIYLTRPFVLSNSDNLICVFGFGASSGVGDLCPWQPCLLSWGFLANSVDVG